MRANRRADGALLEPRPGDVSLDTGLLRGMFSGLVIPGIEEALSSEEKD